MPDDAPTPTRDAYAVLRLRDYRLYIGGSTVAWLGLQMQTVGVQWEIYSRTKEPIYLGLVGLAQIVPVLALSIPAGHVADRFDRRRVLMAAELLLASCSIGLALVSWFHAHIILTYACLAAVGVGRAFQTPAKAALLPQIVPRPIFSHAVTWNTGAFQLASVAGPALGGLLIAHFKSATIVFMLDAVATLAFFLAVLAMRPRPFVPEATKMTAESLAAGARFVWRNKVILSAITLDLFAVLLGGAVALLPVYAQDILHVGPAGYGWLMTAPAVGALGMSLLLAHLPPLRHAGRTLLWSVAGFGAATVVFGLSRSFALSLCMLFLVGALDTISVVIRHTLVQVLTPDAMRGRVSAVNGMFIGASNELGGFRAGAVAQLFKREGWPMFGPMVSVVGGGIGTIAVVVAAALLWPQLRAFGRLDAAKEAFEEPAPTLCTGCGYDLQGLGASRHCPECGHDFDIDGSGRPISRPKPAALP